MTEFGIKGAQVGDDARIHCNNCGATALTEIMHMNHADYCKYGFRCSQCNSEVIITTPTATPDSERSDNT